MDYIAKRELYLPQDAEAREYTDIKTVIYTYEKNGKSIAACFGGRRSTPDWRYRFETEDSRQLYINQHILGERERKAADNIYKAERKAQKEAEFKNIKVGDIFHQGGGYDQTNCRFYELVALKGKTGTFRSIGMETVPGSESFMSCRERPLPGDFRGEEFKCRINGETIKPGYDYASKCNPKSDFYHSWYA